MVLKPFNTMPRSEVHVFQSIVWSSSAAFACRPWVLNLAPCGRSSQTLFTTLTMPVGVSKVADAMILLNWPKNASRSSWPCWALKVWKKGPLSTSFYEASQLHPQNPNMHRKSRQLWPDRKKPTEIHLKDRLNRSVRRNAMKKVFFPSLYVLSICICRPRGSWLLHLSKASPRHSATTSACVEESFLYQGWKCIHSEAIHVSRQLRNGQLVGRDVPWF